MGYYIVFKAQQYQIKTEIAASIKAGVYTSDVTIITIAKNHLNKVQWFDSGKEMRYEGEMYDIVKSSKTDDSTTFYCINDTKEAKLFSYLDKHINTHVSSVPQNKNSKKQSNPIIKLYFSTVQSTYFSSSKSIELTSFKNSIFTTPIIEKNAPPPEFV